MWADQSQQTAAFQTDQPADLFRRGTDDRGVAIFWSRSNKLEQKPPSTPVSPPHHCRCTVCVCVCASSLINQNVLFFYFKSVCGRNSALKCVVGTHTHTSWCSSSWISEIKSRVLWRRQVGGKMEKQVTQFFPSVLVWSAVALLLADNLRDRLCMCDGTLMREAELQSRLGEV